ncbi:thioredoxin family protein [Stratiformator vulcanicus]|uniref:Redoxin n=1 Tax=Stratiformator vulcanicus TaxID=2527980 RepID=A0A517R0E1_9PLAN|nr:thioredoxin family protein [Stratiformator vulcanicus]QDT37367.1 Redoxin [Stratiformator vulcanicus]
MKAVKPPRMSICVVRHVLATLVCAASLGSVTGNACRAGEYNPTLSIGDAAPLWKPLPSADRKQFGSKDFAESKVLLVAFTCETCPYATDYVKRLTAFSEQAANKKWPVAIIAVNSNATPRDQIDAMKRREPAYPFPYLKDESGELGKAFGATRTPEFFVINAERKVVYMGAFDDSTDPEKVTQSYVADAVAAALKGESPEVTETVPIGCNIRYPRRRRPRD